jgi:hypothetical protein
MVKKCDTFHGHVILKISVIVVISHIYLCNGNGS